MTDGQSTRATWKTTTHVKVNIDDLEELERVLSSERFKQYMAYGIKTSIDRQYAKLLGVPFEPEPFVFNPGENVVDAHEKYPLLGAGDTGMDK